MDPNKKSKSKSKSETGAWKGLFAGPPGKKVIITGDPLYPLPVSLDPRAPIGGPVGRGDDPATLGEPMDHNRVITLRKP